MSDGLKNAEKIRVLVLGDSGVFLVCVCIHFQDKESKRTNLKGTEQLS